MSALLHEPMLNAAELDVKIENMEVMPDRVHLSVRANPILPVHYIASQFKWYSSAVSRKGKNRLPSFIPEDTVNKYIEDQKNGWSAFFSRSQSYGQNTFGCVSDW